MINKEGFWWSKSEPYLPTPIPQDVKWKGRKAFLEALANVEAKAQRSAYKGSSKCRVCDCTNGSEEYRYSFMKSEWVWPEGYRHYIKAHNVRPSQAFQEFIMAADAASIIAKGLKRA